MNSTKLFWKNSIIYGVGSIFIRAISFFLLPLYTNAFTRSETGYIFLIFTFISFAQIIYFYGQDAAFLKFYNQNSNDQKIVGYTSYILLLITSTLFTAIILFFSNTISIQLIDIDKGTWIIYSAFILFFDTISSRIMLILRIKEKSWIFLIISIITVVVSITTSYVLVINFDYNIDGIFLGTLSGILIKFIFLIPYQINIYKEKQFSFIVAKKLLKFGFPFFLSAFFYLILELSDRYLIFWILGSEHVGVYSIGYKIGSLGLFIVSAFNLGWQPFYIKIGANPSSNKLFGNIGTSFIFFLITIWGLIIFWTPLFMQIKIGNNYLIGASFWASVDIITIIFLSYIFYAGYIVLMPCIYLCNKEIWSPIIRGSGAIINIILNLILIKKFGLMGACCSTLVSYVFMFIFILYKSRLWFKVLCDWRSVLIHLILTSILIFYFRGLDNNFSVSFLFTIMYFIMIAIIFKKTIISLNRYKSLVRLFYNN